MDVTTDRTGTLRAEAHHPPVVLDVPFSAGFCTEHSAHSRSIGYEMEMAPTLRAGVVPAAVYENHSQDSRYTGPLSTAPTVNATYGMGGNNQPFVIEQNAPPYTLKIRCGKEGGGKGALIQDDKSATLGCSNDQTLFAPEEQTAFGTSSDKIHAMRSDNPHAGIYESQTARTLDAQCGHPGCHQGGIAVVEKAYPIEGNGLRPSHHGDGWNDADTMFTLNATEQHGVAVALADRDVIPSAQDGSNGSMFANPEEDDLGQPSVYSSTVSNYITASEEVAQTLMARDFKDPQIVNQPHYIVRRLTPVECARLQGFPDWWCSCLATEEPTEEDISFWHEVWETHRKVIGTAKKPKSRNQLVKWLKSPHSDAAEYKMWGNGVALPCVWFVLAGIVYYNQFMG